MSRFVGAKQLFEVPARPTPGQHQVLLGFGEQAGGRVVLESFEVPDLDRGQLISDVAPRRHTAIVSTGSDSPRGSADHLSVHRHTIRMQEQACGYRGI